MAFAYFNADDILDERHLKSHASPTNRQRRKASTRTLISWMKVKCSGVFGRRVKRRLSYERATGTRWRPVMGKLIP